MREKIEKEYQKRIRMGLKSELNAVNKIERINTVAIPVVTYSYNVINWKPQEIENLGRKNAPYEKTNTPSEIRCRQNIFTKIIRWQRPNTVGNNLQVYNKCFGNVLGKIRRFSPEVRKPTQRKQKAIRGT